MTIPTGISKMFSSFLITGDTRNFIPFQLFNGGRIVSTFQMFSSGFKRQERQTTLKKFHLLHIKIEKEYIVVNELPYL